jgi:hypothetical protein
MVQKPSHVKQLSPIHVCKIGLKLLSTEATSNPSNSQVEKQLAFVEGVYFASCLGILTIIGRP